jgi:choline dehydrogenase-like flavoprotein
MTEPPAYPAGTVRRLLGTALVTPKTLDVIAARLVPGPPREPRYFDAQAHATLAAACDRVVPQSHRTAPVDLAGFIDERLANQMSDGWRYASMPPDGEAFIREMTGLDEAANTLFGDAFCALEGAAQDEVLTRVQAGDPPGTVWQTMPSPRFFEELLAELAECYYSDPISQEEIGYVGMADARGWRAIGPDELEPWEPRPIGSGGAARQHGRPVAMQQQSGPGGAAGPHAGADAAAPHRARLARLPPPRPSPALPAMRRYRLAEPVDAVVVGTGAGGAPLMARLAAAGVSVVALEAGRHWDPATEFATDERSQSKLFWNDERLSDGSDPMSFGINNSGIGVGGSTLHYTAFVPRARADDLRLRTQFGVGVDWPLALDDLLPYYDELEEFLGVSGPSPYPWGGPRSGYPLPPLPLNGAAQLMRGACRALGITTSPSPSAALSRPRSQPGFGVRPACSNRGFCQAGCTTGAKASMDVTYIPIAIAAGAEVRSESFVTGIEITPSGLIDAVVYVTDGREHRQRCRSLFLCAGAIETPRLLLLNGLANSSGEVGRNFMAHMARQVWGRFDADIRPYKGIPGALISEDHHRPKDADFAGGYLLQSLGVMPVTYASQLARGRGVWGDAFTTQMRGYNNAAGINIVGECLPRPENRVQLADERDARGLPKPRVHFSLGPNERRLLAHADAQMRAIWTCRMGSAATSAVVDPDGRSFDVPNLYISDNSTFPSALSVNPALTVMALSLRTADRFLQRARRGEA